MSERARKHFNTTCPEQDPKFVTLFGWVFGISWASDRWTTITDTEKELTHFLRVGKNCSMNGLTSYTFIFWRLSIIAVNKNQ